MVDFHFRTLGAMTALAVLLSGCSVNGSYPDAREPDAAKLRFISGATNATLFFFDADHCDGFTTGTLNNLLLANTKRRANMTVAPPADTEAYLEVKLTPGKEVFALVNTNNGSSVCTSAFNFTPQSNSEYELGFNIIGDQCHTSLKRLQQTNTGAVRSSIPLVEKGLPACAGRNALFRKSANAMPDTPERVVLFEQIIADSLTAQMKPDADTVDLKLRAQNLDRLIAERQKQIGFSLPDAYWAEYRQHLNTFTDEATGSKAKALELYKGEYRSRLQRLDTAALKELAPADESQVVTKALEANNVMLQYYYTISKQVRAQSMSDQLARMADLDRRYAVCERFSGCWKN